MMKIYVISLIKDSDRRDLLKESFIKNYGTFNIFNALNHRDAKNYLSKGGNLKENKLEMTLSEVACALSHLEVLKKTIENDKAFSLILEDDIIGTDEDIERITHVYLSLPKDSILIAGGQEGLRSFKNLYGTLMDEQNKLYKIHNIYYRYLSRACCYVLSGETAIKIIQLQETGLDRADQWDHLLKECSNVYFSPILKHPLTLENSHIEKERKLMKRNSIFTAIMKEGVIYSLYYYLRKIVTSYWAIYKGYIKIKDNS
ncbi:glycosyltransferase family 25 protein [Acinetobacter johnsonii]|uniref:glycosyltransferase family 25 protein n=1 Tax=Acinetobacter johnsonii TaxID=40214 RepID=UPI0032B3DD0B